MTLCTYISYIRVYRYFSTGNFSLRHSQRKFNTSYIAKRTTISVIAFYLQPQNIFFSQNSIGNDSSENAGFADKKGSFVGRESANPGVINSQYATDHFLRLLHIVISQWKNSPGKFLPSIKNNNNNRRPSAASYFAAQYLQKRCVPISM